MEREDGEGKITRDATSCSWSRRTIRVRKKKASGGKGEGSETTTRTPALEGPIMCSNRGHGHGRVGSDQKRGKYKRISEKRRNQARKREER